MHTRWIAMISLFSLLIIDQASAAIEVKGPFQDPAHYAAGWTSAAYADIDGGCILFLFGSLSHDNSVRCFFPATGEFRYIQPVTEREDSQITGDGINNRDNHVLLNIPGRGLLVAAGAYLKGKPYVGGFFDYDTLKWTYRWSADDTVEFIAPWGGYPLFNAAAAWSKKYGMGVIYGSEQPTGSPTRLIVLVYPNGDGTFRTEEITDIVSGTPPCIRARNSAVAVGDWMYVYGGMCRTGASTAIEDTAWFYRFNLITHKWQRLADAPYVRRMPIVTYDQATHNIVVYGGGENKYTPSSTVMTWNVDTQGPWEDRTTEAGMPAVRSASGAYDPTTGFHCYRGGLWGNKTYDRVWCMRFAPGPGDNEVAAEPLPTAPLQRNADSSPSSPPGKTATNSTAKRGRVTPASTDSGGVSLPPPGVIAFPPASGNASLRPPSPTASSNPAKLVPPSSGFSRGSTPQTSSTPNSTNRQGYPSPRRDNGGSTANVVATVQPQVIVRDIPPSKERSAPQGAAKHVRFTEATTGDGRLYLVSGDWEFPDKWGSSGRQETIAYDPFADKWQVVVPYCTPDGQQPYHTDEVLQAWDTKRNLLWIGPGVYFGARNACPGLTFMMAFDPERVKWSRPAQDEAPEFLGKIGMPTFGLYDSVTDSMVIIHDTKIVEFFPDTGKWEISAHPWGNFSESPPAQIGRWVYFTNEGEYSLWRFNIDTRVFEEVGLLPAALRDGDGVGAGDGHGRIWLSAIGSKIAMYQYVDAEMKINSDMYVLDTETMEYTEIRLPEGVAGWTFTWHSSGWGFIFGGTVGFDMMKNPMKHFYLVDLRQFGGTGEPLNH